jgi:hypothetical protein
MRLIGADRKKAAPGTGDHRRSPAARICGRKEAVTTGKSQIRSKGRLDYVWEVRGVTRRLEEGSVWLEEDGRRRNRRNSPVAVAGIEVDGDAMKTSRTDSLRQEVEDDEGRRLVVAASLGAAGDGRSTVRRHGTVRVSPLLVALQRKRGGSRWADRICVVLRSPDKERKGGSRGAGGAGRGGGGGPEPHAICVTRKTTRRGGEILFPRRGTGQVVGWAACSGREKERERAGPPWERREREARRAREREWPRGGFSVLFSFPVFI